jgi:DNA-directed RNA polymerase subunit RPC12/RpoP
MIEIECPNCNSIGKMSLVQQIFEGPYRCWKCRSLFTIVIANKRLQSCEPLSEEDFKKWQDEQEALKRKSKE